MKRKSVLQCLAITSILLHAGENAQARTLAESVELALHFDPTLAEASAQYTAAQGDLATADAARYPTVTVGASSIRTEIGKPAEQQQAGIIAATASYVLFDGGLINHDIHQKKALLDSSRYSYRNSHEDTVLGTTLIHMEILKQQALLQVADDNITAHQRIVDNVRQIANIDKGRESEWIQASARLERARAARTAIEVRLHDAESSYTRLTGAPPVELVYRSFPAISQDNPDWLTHNPEWRQARADIQAARATTAKTASAYWPQVSVQISQSNAVNDSGDRVGASAGIIAEWKAYQGSATSAAVKAANARSNAAYNHLRSIETDLEKARQQYHHNADILDSRLKTLQTLAQQSAQVRTAYWEQYTAARRNILDVLNAENEYAETQALLVSTRFDQQSNRARWLSLMQLLLTVVRS